MSWVGVDFDGTLAIYDRWRGPGHVGKPIPAMIARVQEWLKQGKRVKVFTARVAKNHPQHEIDEATDAISKFCAEHIGQILPITSEKDQHMIVLYDDRCVAVEKNTGKLLSPSWF